MRVPFVNLKDQYHKIEAEVQDALKEVLNSTAFVGGPFTQKFEGDWAEYCGCKYCVGVGSGTEALWLILLALDIGPGDEVITVPNTFIATAEAITLTGAKPVFVDIDRKYYTMDPTLLENVITPSTKIIVPVHLYGQMADMDPIVEIARKNGLQIVEDACQAHGAEYMQTRAGSFGKAAAFSFYPGKNLGAYGDAGAVVTNDKHLAERIVMLRNHGQSKKYMHRCIGWNARLDGIQAAILSVKLKSIDSWNNLRRKWAKLYDQMLDGVDGIIIPTENADCKHIYHVYTVRVENRDTVAEFLNKRGITTGIHYPFIIPDQEAYNHLHKYSTSLHIARSYSNQYLSLPMFPEMSEEQVRYVASTLVEAVSKSRKKGTYSLVSSSLP